jgi:hypothetical protein
MLKILPLLLASGKQLACDEKIWEREQVYDREITIQPFQKPS